MKKLLLIALLLITGVVYSQSFPEPVRFSYSGTDTNTIGDTLSRKVLSTSNTLTTKYQDWFQVIIATDDTIQVSTDTLWTNNMIIMPYESLVTPKYNIRYFKNLYWKVLGVGVANVRWFLFGN